MARVQAQWARDYLLEKGFAEALDFLPLTTTGDKQAALEQKGGKGLFTKELELALLDGRACVAVHSAKDVPTEMDARLCIAAYLPKACAQDILIYSEALNLPVLPDASAVLASLAQQPGLVLATGSPRRREQLRLHLPHLAGFEELRGNVATRLTHITKNPHQLTLLAAAGLERLGYSGSAPTPGLRGMALPINAMVPAAGQGAIALQCRAEDYDRFNVFTHAPTHLAVTLERRLLQLLGGGCHSALGVHYADGSLWVFHPKIGVREYAVSSENQEKTLEAIAKNLS